MEFTVTVGLLLVACVVALVMLITTLVHVREVTDVHLEQAGGEYVAQSVYIHVHVYNIIVYMSTCAYAHAYVELEYCLMQLVLISLPFYV